MDRGRAALVASVKDRWSLERQVRLGAGLLVLIGVLLALTLAPLWILALRIRRSRSHFRRAHGHLPDGNHPWKIALESPDLIAGSEFPMRNHPCPIGDSFRKQLEPHQCHNGFVDFDALAPATQRCRLSANDPRLRQSRGCRRRAHRSLAQSFPPSGSVARIRSLPRLARTNRETCLLAIERARIFASAPATLYSRGRRPRTSWVGDLLWIQACAARNEGSAADKRWRHCRHSIVRFTNCAMSRICRATRLREDWESPERP